MVSTHHKKNRTRHYHQILQAVIAQPDMRQFLLLAPEAVQNTDSKEKQDCETNAGKGLVAGLRNFPSLSPAMICIPNSPL